MPWNITYSQDTEIPGVGTASATFTDDAGQVVVSHSGRLDGRDGATISGFIDEALTKYARHLKVSGDSDALLAKIQTVLNEKTGAK